MDQPDNTHELQYTPKSYTEPLKRLVDEDMHSHVKRSRVRLRPKRLQTLSSLYEPNTSLKHGKIKPQELVQQMEECKR